MDALSIKFHPLFIIFAFVLIYFGWWQQFLVYFIVMLLHELSHYFVAKYYGYKLNNIVFMPYGVGIGGKDIYFKPSHEIIIAMAGPLANLVLIILTVFLWFCFPSLKNVTQFFVEANIILGAFNLLPILPLDGGRVLFAFIKNQKAKIIMYRLMFIFGIIFSFACMILFLVSAFIKLNLSFVFIAYFVLSSCFNYKDEIYFERGLININKADMPLEIKNYAVSIKTPVHKLVKYIKGHTYVNFYVYDNNKLVKILSENDIKNLIFKK